MCLCVYRNFSNESTAKTALALAHDHVIAPIRPSLPGMWSAALVSNACRSKKKHANVGVSTILCKCNNFCGERAVLQAHNSFMPIPNIPPCNTPPRVTTPRLDVVSTGFCRSKPRSTSSQHCRVANQKRAALGSRNFIESGARFADKNKQSPHLHYFPTISTSVKKLLLGS